MTCYRGRSIAAHGARLMIALGVAMVVVTLVHGGGVGVMLGRALRRRRRGRLWMLRRQGPLVARKLPGLRRELDARALFSVAYGEIASSIYFALGVARRARARLHAARAARRRRCSSSSSRSRTPRAPRRCPRRAAPRRSSAAPSTTSPAS